MQTQLTFLVYIETTLVGFAETNNPYWFNIESGESVWEMPEAMQWSKVPDEETG